MFENFSLHSLFSGVDFDVLIELMGPVLLIIVVLHVCNWCFRMIRQLVLEHERDSLRDELRNRKMPVLFVDLQVIESKKREESAAIFDFSDYEEVDKEKKDNG